VWKDFSEKRLAPVRTISNITEKAMGFAFPKGKTA
jgi:hypothetical protein